MHSLKVTPKDFFLWVGAMVALYGSAIAFITLLFQYINYAFPDPLGYSYVDPFSGGMRFAMASLIVLVPVAIALMRLIRNDIKETPAKSELWIRRWALMLTLFITGAAIVIDLIVLINNFLGGDLTTPFILKVLVVLSVAGLAFMHFLADLWGYWTENPGRAQVVGYSVGILVVAAIISGFFIMGTPGEVRLKRFDSQKVSDLQNIQYQIVNFWQQKERLPDTLNEVADPLSGASIPKDPQSGEEYRYEKTGPMTFKLCAAFNAQSTPEEASRARAYEPLYGAESWNWQHGEGEQCFERTIDPERYPPYEKPTTTKPLM